jgi:hypothetical protein
MRRILARNMIGSEHQISPPYSGGMYSAPSTHCSRLFQASKKGKNDSPSSIPSPMKPRLACFGHQPPRNLSRSRAQHQRTFATTASVEATRVKTMAPSQGERRARGASRTSRPSNNNTNTNQGMCQQCATAVLLAMQKQGPVPRNLCDENASCNNCKLLGLPCTADVNGATKNRIAAVAFQQLQSQTQPPQVARARAPLALQSTAFAQRGPPLRRDHHRAASRATTPQHRDRSFEPESSVLGTPHGLPVAPTIRMTPPRNTGFDSTPSSGFAVPQRRGRSPVSPVPAFGESLKRSFAGEES